MKNLSIQSSLVALRPAFSLMEILVSIVLIGLIGTIIMYYGTLTHKSSQRTSKSTHALNLAVASIEDYKRQLSDPNFKQQVINTIETPFDSFLPPVRNTTIDGTTFKIKPVFTRAPNQRTILIKITSRVTWQNQNISLATTYYGN